MKHECDNCCAMTENEPVCLCDECNSGCSTCSDYERRYEDLLTKHSETLKRVEELEADNRRLDSIVHGQDFHAVQAAWERMGGAPDPLNPGFFVCNSILTDQWEALRRAAFNEPQDQ